MSYPKLKATDPNCKDCSGRGFSVRPDGGAGSAKICRCRLPGGSGAPATEKPGDRTPQAVLDLEALADSITGEGS